MPSYCPNALANGSCSTDGCSLRHNVRHCEACNRWFMPSAWRSHVNGEKHRRRSAATQTTRPSNTPQASPRSSTTQSQRQRSSGSRPIAGLTVPSSVSRDERPVVPHTQPPPPTPPLEYVICEICGRRIHRDNTDRHNRRDRGHLKALNNLEVERELRAARSDKRGISVTHPEGIDFGIIESNQIEIKVNRMITVSGLNESPHISLVDLTITSALFFDNGDSSFRASRSQREPNRIIVAFEDPQDGDGEYRATLTLVFFDASTNEAFSILRDLRATVGNAEHHQRFQSEAQYAEPPRSSARSRGAQPKRVFNAPRPEGWTQIENSMRLLKYEIPLELQDTLSRRLNTKVVREKFIPKTLNSETHGKHFQVLLWIEEFHKRKDLLEKSMLLQNITVRSSRRYYSIETDHLRDLVNLAPLVEPRNRKTSLETLSDGDILLFSPVGPEDVSFEARIHRIEEREIILRFSDGFNLHKHGSQFRVQLVLNRVPYRRAHLAVSMNYPLDRLLWPNFTADSSFINNLRLEADTDNFLRNNVRPHILSNDEQLRAIKNILTRPPGSPPSLVFGPPGTGKTTTIAEAMRVLLIRSPSAHILACTPSNYAADVIALRLLELGLESQSMFRLNAFGRPVQDLLPLRHICSISVEEDNYEHFSLPTSSHIARYKIIVCTTVTAGILPTLGIRRGHFSTIYLDEASQVHEPSSLIPFRLLCDEETNIVLAGDSKQLQPVITSEIARQLGLGKSLFERLENIYSESKSSTSERGNNVFENSLNAITLRDNYRSHSDILEFANRMFYHNRLRARGDPSITDRFLNLDVLPTPGHPIIFHGVRGTEKTDGHSPSFFNLNEASVVVNYVNELLSRKPPIIEEKGIGIISPYNAQCMKIQVLLKSHTNIRVGNVEQFQGQERIVIIISTVRSANGGKLGFVADPKRLNVMITRARALLIVVGDPNVLSKDPVWANFIAYMQSKGAYSSRGLAFNPLPYNEDGL